MIENRNYSESTAHADDTSQLPLSPALTSKTELFINAEHTATAGDITPLISARNDADLIAAFLGQKKSSGEPKFSDNTRQSYEKELRRLLLFCRDHQLSLLGTDLNNIQAFIEWLQSPPKAYIGSSRRPFHDPEWCPFSGGLSATSLHQSIAVCKSFFTFLQKVGFARLNPFLLVDTNTQARRVAESTRKNRSLLLEDIRAVRQFYKKKLNDTPTRFRQRWLFDAYLYSGVRLSDLLNHNTTALRSEHVKGESIWLLHLIGKGGKPASLPVSRVFTTAFFDYRRSLGKSPIPEINATDPFFYSLSGKPLSTRQSIHNIFKNMIYEVADACDIKGNFEQGRRLRQSSVHWLRHSFITIGLDVSQDIPAIAELARHADIKTTLGYDKSQYLHLTAVLDQMAESIHGETES